MERKTTVWIFQATIWQNLTRENMDMATKEKPLKKKMNRFLYNDIKTNYIKVDIEPAHWSSG